MSWDGYIDNLLGHCKDNADKAAIIGIDGSKWTSDASPKAIKVSPAEAKNIGDVFKNKAFQTFQGSGVIVEGQKYTYLRVLDDKLVFAKKKGEGSLSLQCTNTAVVLAHTIEGKSQGETNKGVAVIAEYLESLNM